MGARKYEGDSLAAQVAEALKDLGVTLPAPKVKEKPHPPSDDELRDRWVAKHPLTAFGASAYRRYANGYWPVLHKQQVRSEIQDIIEAAKAEGVQPTLGRLESVCGLADASLFIADELWNAKTNVLVMQNGTLDISERRLRPHDPEDYATERLTYAYDPRAKAPAWERYLNSSLRDVRDFVQEFAGYCLTTDVRHEIALWFVGVRGSGKSTGVLGFQTLLGPKIGWLGLADIEKTRFSLINLPGKNLCIATEQPALYMQASNILNAIISGEPVTVERKYHDSYTFTPYTKILWSMNSLPRVGDTNDGIFRRVKVVRFPALPVEQQDTTLKDLIACEGAGILNWALAGLERLTSRGRFCIPQCVTDATEQFQNTNDVPAHFVSDECEVGDFHEQSSVLYAAYKRWTDENGHKHQSATSMAGEWERMGFTRYRADGKTYYRGIRVRGLLT